MTDYLLFIVILGVVMIYNRVRTIDLDVHEIKKHFEKREKE